MYRAEEVPQCHEMISAYRSQHGMDPTPRTPQPSNPLVKRKRQDNGRKTKRKKKRTKTRVDTPSANDQVSSTDNMLDERKSVHKGATPAFVWVKCWRGSQVVRKQLPKLLSTRHRLENRPTQAVGHTNRHCSWILVVANTRFQPIDELELLLFRYESFPCVLSHCYYHVFFNTQRNEEGLHYGKADVVPQDRRT